MHHPGTCQAAPTKAETKRGRCCPHWLSDRDVYIDILNWLLNTTSVGCLTLLFIGLQAGLGRLWETQDIRERLSPVFADQD